MKRHNNLWEKIVSFDNLVEAYRKARKGKTWQRKVQEFDKDATEKLMLLQEQLIAGTYTTSEYKIKKIYEPKEREIFILPFYPDRIVHHALMNILEPIWDKLMIFDSYACRKNKGIHKGSRRTMEFVRRNNYCLQLDIKKFYPSIDHDIMFGIVQKKIKCKQTLDLLRNIIYSIPGNKNIPIGNYTSQWLGNLYMNEVDMFIKHELRTKDYLRYCDDFVLFGNTKKQLQNNFQVLKSFLFSKLKLHLSKNRLFPTTLGVDFLGYKHFKSGFILLRKQTVKRVKQRLAILPYLFRKHKLTVEQITSSIASTKGWLKWCNSHNLKLRLQLDNLLLCAQW